MRIIKYAFLIAVMLLPVHCSYAQSGNEKAEKTEEVEAISGEVMMINKKDFLEKIYNYEKNKDSFVYEGDLPCVIDFYADWCGPCKKVEPILKELAGVYKGKVLFFKINVDNEKELAQFFRIQSIPTFFFIPVQGELRWAERALPRESFVEAIDKILLNKQE